MWQRRMGGRGGGRGIAVVKQDKKFGFGSTFRKEPGMNFKHRYGAVELNFFK